MANKTLYIALAEPVITIDIISLEDVTGNTAKVSTIWKRPISQEEANKDSKALQKVLGETFQVSDEELLTLTEEDITNQFEAFAKNQVTFAEGLVKKYFVGFKQVTVSFYDDAGNLQKLKIDDSRRETNREGFWENAEECREVLLGHFLEQLPWQSQFVATLSGLLFNKNLIKEAKGKN